MAERPSPQLRAAARQLTSARQQYVRASRARQESSATFARRISSASLAIVIAIIAIALIADILSIFDLGWLISWALAICTWYIGRRITVIRQISAELTTASTNAYQQTARLIAQLRPIAITAGRAALVAPPSKPLLVATRSYLTTYLRDTVVAQLIELIPVIDILPFYLGGAVKILVNQRQAHREAQRALQQYQQLSARLDALELFALEYRETIFTASRAVPSQQPRARIPRPTPTTAIRVPAFAS